MDRRSFLRSLLGVTAAAVVAPKVYILPPPNGWRPQTGRWLSGSGIGRLYVRDVVLDKGFQELGDVTNIHISSTFKHKYYSGMVSSFSLKGSDIVMSDEFKELIIMYKEQANESSSSYIRMRSQSQRRFS